MPFETSNSKLKALLLLLGSFALIACCLWVVLNPDAAADTNGYSRHTQRAKAMGGLLPYLMWVGILLFGTSAVLGLFKFFDSKPKIRFDEYGVYAARMSDDVISWSNIHGIDRKDIKIQKSNQNWAILRVTDSSDIVFKRTSKTKVPTSPGFKTVHFLMNGHKHNPDQIWEELIKAAKVYKA